MDAVSRSRELRSTMSRRRSIRVFEDRTVPEEVVGNCIAVACSAPSGANLQPWTFVLVGDPRKKTEIREAAETVERDFYERRAPDEWKERLKPLDVDWRKPFLTQAPWLICVFVQNHGLGESGEVIKHYYPKESTGIAVGFLLSALHQTGLGALPYTPAPMGFLASVLDRPSNERPYMIIPVGYPEPGYEPPDIKRKDLVLIRA
jgi:iodotyrosine deiodinase